METEQTPVEPVTEQTPVQPVETPSEASTFLTDDGKFTDAYLDSLPDELGKHSIIDKYGRDPVNVLKGAVNLSNLAGKKAEEFWVSEDPDVVAKRREVMGVPKDKSGYAYDSSDIPEEFQEKAVENADKFMEFAAEKGYPKAMVEEILQWDKGRGVEAIETAKEQKATSTREAEEFLRNEWKGDKYDYNIAKVSNAMEHLGLGEFKDNPKYANDPDFIMAMNEKIVPLLEDDVIIEAKQKQNYATISDTLKELDDRMYSYTGNTNDPAYRNMIKERGELLQKIARK